MNANLPARQTGFTLVVSALLLCANAGSLSAQPELETKVAETNATMTDLEFVRVTQLLQEQLLTMQQSLERSRQDAETAASHSAEVLAAHLSAIQQSWEKQRTTDLDSIRTSIEEAQASNHLLIRFTVGFAAVGLVAFLLTSFIQWRTAQRLAEVAATLPSQRVLGEMRALPEVTGTGTSLATVNSVQQANARVVNVVERLEKRIVELEQMLGSRPAVAAGNSDGNASKALGDGQPLDGQVSVLLGRGQSLLSLGQAAEALAAFDDALALSPNHAEAHIKRGAALERLDRLEEALASYDRALAADGSMTLAHLHKGSLYNRMARYTEALACYEQALKTQGKARAA